MRVRPLRIGPFVGLAAVALLAACTPVAAPAPAPVDPIASTRSCGPSGSSRAGSSQAGSSQPGSGPSGATSSATIDSPTDSPTLSSTEAAADAGLAFTDATDRLPDGRVPLVTIEQRDGHLDIRTTAVSTAADAADAAVAAAQGDDLVAVVPDTIVETEQVGGPTASAATTNDTDRSRQWALDQAGFESAWDLADGTGVTVAVVDTGVQASHPDLAGQVLAGYRFFHSGSTPNSAPMSPAYDDNGHGTHVAGIIAAVANNTRGIAGGAPGACILPVKVLNASGSGWDSDVARGIDWAVTNGAKVINLSLGSGSPGATDVAVDNAVANDVMVFAAAGNGGAGAAPEYPGANANAIAVASVTSALARSSFSTTGSYVDIAAPGSGIWSTYPTSGYASLSGTSMATPYAAATGALIRSRFPAWTVAQVRQRLLDTANDLGATGPDDEYGYGFIDPAAATG